MTTSPAILTIDILRHGETTNDGGKLYGTTDIPLSDKGKEQLRSAAATISTEPLSHVISSPKQRCSWLAKEHLDQVTATFDQGFSEMDFGDWEGRDISSLIKEEPGFQLNLSELNPPNGESFKNFSRRVCQTWADYTQKHIEHGGHHLLVTHGGVIRVLLGLTLHIPDEQLSRLYIPHATWSRITLVQGQTPMLWFMNCHD